MLTIKSQPRNSQSQWVEYSPGVKFLLKSLLNEDYLAAQTRLERFNASQRQIYQQTGMPSDIVKNRSTDRSEIDVQAEMLATYIVQDWQGVTDEEGNEVPYSVQQGHQLMKQNADVFLRIPANVNAPTG